MTPQFAIDVIRQALLTAFWICVPMLVLGFAAGIAISLVQIATSMQDSAFSTIPRLVVFLTGLIVFLPWMLIKMTGYTTAILGNLGRYAH
jgi:flagellar biosynthetic protein FliQ